MVAAIGVLATLGITLATDHAGGLAKIAGFGEGALVDLTIAMGFALLGDRKANAVMSLAPETWVSSAGHFS